MFVKIMNYPHKGFQRVIECDEFLLDEPWYRARKEDPESPTKLDLSSKLNIVKRKHCGGFETEIIDITNIDWDVFIMSSETGKTIESYRWGHTYVNGPLIRSFIK